MRIFPPPLRCPTASGRVAPALLALVLGLASCGGSPPPSERPVPEVVTLTVRTEPVTLQTELPGRVAAQMTAEVRPQVSGILLERLFVEGQRVRRGQVLYRIDPAPYETVLERAEAALASSEAAARSSALLLERYRQLLPERSISQQDYDNAEVAVAQAEATIRERRAAVNAARIDLQWTRVAAPIDGRTGRSLVTPGQLVSANQAAALTTISQPDPVYVDVTQSSADLLRLRRAALEGRIDRGDDAARSVSLVLEDGSAYPHEGRLRLAEIGVEASTGTVTLRAEFPNPDGLLLPGMYVRAVLTEGVHPAAVLIPQQALKRNRQGRSEVHVVNAEDQVEVRDVVATRAIGTRWLVEQGLSPGDVVILEGGQNAPPGTAVRITPGP